VSASDAPASVWAGTPAALLRRAQMEGFKTEHTALVMRMTMMASMYTNRIRIQGADGYKFIRDAIREECCYWLKHNDAPLRWGHSQSTQLRWKPCTDGTFLTCLDLDVATSIIMPTTPALYINPQTLMCGHLQGSVPEELLSEWATPRAPLELEAAMAFCRTLAARHLGAVFPLPGTAGVMVERNASPTPCLCIRNHLLRLAAGHHVSIPVVRLSFDYGLAQAYSADPADAMVVAENGWLIRCVRDRGLEDAAIARLKTLGFAPVEDLPGDPVTSRLRDWFLSPEAPLDWAAIQTTAFPDLVSSGWRIDQNEQVKVETIPDDAWYSELAPATEGWFDFRVGICVHGRRVDLLPVIHHLLAQNRGRPTDDIRRLLENRQIPVPLEPSGFALVSGTRLYMIIREVLELSDVSRDTPSAPVRLDVWRAAEIAQLEKLAASPWNCAGDLGSLMERLALARSLSPMNAPRSLRTVLRPYQRLGLAWLQFIREADFGGILADDMGLGKTVQTLAHLLIEKKAGRLTRPCLIVSPTSVIHNWVDETRRFAPSLKTLVLHGSDRHDEFDKLPGSEVIFTTYPLLRRDADKLQQHVFSIVILDEAQYIKNHRAITTQVAGSLKSDRRLCLTGTPLENHLGELWSLFHFLMPGFLGSEETFRKRFRDPIERDGNEQTRQFLSRRVAPFLLRRRKIEVEKDLPAKTITTQGVDLTGRQQEMYEAVRLTVQAKIKSEVEARGLERSQITILTALLKLRQICCDPRLAGTQASNDASSADSAKLQALMEMVPEMLEEGRRILLFSQFVGMLTLIETELKARSIQYALLTGSTRDRPAQVRRFQEGEVGVFLISLKAGGTGLNLTAADTVIHYDPWWNPAVENQATDRAHRIGQSKPVFVYRLIATGTVEARIHAMQARKQNLADGMFQEQKADSIRFSMEDLTMLFSPIGGNLPKS